MNAPAYAPVGSAEELFYSQAPEILLSGPAGTGKSRAQLEKLYLLMLMFPGARGLIVRKTRASLTQTGLVTLEQKVFPPNSGLKRNTVTDSYRLPNGSEIVCAGLDNAVRIMSTEYDIICVLEATELTPTDYESLTTRLRNGVVPFQQLLGDCNPGHPKHWLKQRADRGDILLIHTTHRDNPTLWDGERGTWTKMGAQYISKLQKLTGVRRSRLYEGKWVASEGQVYKEWNDALHVIDPFPIPAEWRRFRVVDFGYTNPFVCQWWAQGPDGELYRYREIYYSGRIVEDHAKTIMEVESPEERAAIEATICDHDAEDRATLERHLNTDTIPAHKSVSDGIQAVEARLRPNGPEGKEKPRLFFFRDVLVELDSSLEELKKPLSTVEEFPGYEWAQTQHGDKKEVPVKVDDHGVDATRYLVAHVDGIAQNGGGFFLGVVQG